MATTQYALHLKGFVGGADFDRNYVDFVLSKNEGKAAPKLTDAVASEMAAIGMPIPNIPVADSQSAFGRVLSRKKLTPKRVKNERARRFTTSKFRGYVVGFA